MTHEDLGTNARTQQLEEKTVAHSMTSSATRQEQRTVTQEVKTTSTVVSGDQVIFYLMFSLRTIDYFSIYNLISDSLLRSSLFVSQQQIVLISRYVQFFLSCRKKCYIHFKFSIK